MRVVVNQGVKRCWEFRTYPVPFIDSFLSGNALLQTRHLCRPSGAGWTRDSRLETRDSRLGNSAHRPRELHYHIRLLTHSHTCDQPESHTSLPDSRVPSPESRVPSPVPRVPSPVPRVRSIPASVYAPYVSAEPTSCVVSCLWLGLGAMLGQRLVLSINSLSCKSESKGKAIQ